MESYYRRVIRYDDKKSNVKGPLISEIAYLGLKFRGCERFKRFGLTYILVDYIPRDIEDKFPKHMSIWGGELTPPRWGYTKRGKLKYIQ